MTSSNCPSTSWGTGIHHEALRIIYYLNRLPDQALQNRGFLILPTINTKYRNQIIVLPDLNYTSIPNLWKQISRLKAITPMEAPPKLTNDVINLLQPTYKPPQSELKRLQDNWMKIHSKFFQQLNQLLPQLSHLISHINFIVCRSGTCSQFNLVSPNKSRLTIYLRHDAQISDIAQAVLLSSIRDTLVTVERRTWEEIEAISDFLLKHTPLHQSILPHYHQSMMPVLQQLQDGSLHKKTLEFQSKIGLPTTNNWHIKQGNIFYHHQEITGLTHRQQLLLHTLVDQHEQIVSIDQIANNLWPNDENYSLWAIVKEIARIRHCLTSSGIPGHLLKSHRKRGYTLV